ncbi:MAG TPA: hypothetical protein PK728_03525 [Bacillota bacterium]|nr:hypothetical protein [Bacillota bacterium]
MMVKSVDKMHLVNMDKVKLLSLRPKYGEGGEQENYELVACFGEDPQGTGGPVVLAEGDIDTLGDIMIFIENKFTTIDLAKIYKSILSSRQRDG